jgi:hypothetical protein
MWMSHGDQVTKLPEGYKIVASTKDCEIAAVAFDSDKPERQIFGIQFHPEVTHSKFGMKLLENFIDFTGAKKTWNMKSYLPLITQRIKDQVKDRKVFLLVSGGVDSTVAFVLLNRVLGPEKVLGLHVDNGMMRLGESQKIMDFLTKEGMNNLKIRDASGTVAWIERKAVSERRTLIVRVPVADVLATPEASAPLVFKVEQNVVLELVDPAHVSNTPGWAKVRHRDGQQGYIRIGQVWGL